MDANTEPAIGTTTGDAAQGIRSNLFEIFELARDIEKLHEATGGEVDWKSEQLQAWLEQSSGRTVEEICDFVELCEGKAALARSKAERLKEFAANEDARVAWARKLLIDVLHQLGVSKAEHGEWRVHLRKGSASVKQTGDVNLALLDDELVREVPAKLEANLKAIGERLKKGEDVEGYALVTGPETVVIK
jgi:hypothetical protein